jgi:hypothetical protein
LDEKETLKELEILIKQFLLKKYNYFKSKKIMVEPLLSGIVFYYFVTIAGLFVTAYLQSW